MGARRIWGVTVLTLAVAAVGCQPKVEHAPEPAPISDSGRLPTPSTQPADDASAEALARRAEEWAKILEEIRAKREQAATKPAAVATTAPAVTPPAETPAPETSIQVGPKAEPVVEKPMPGAGLVFSPPAAAPAAPLIQVSPPVTPTTQPAQPVATPKVIVKDALVERVESGVKAAPRDASANLDLQLVRFLKDEQTPDVASLAGLPAEDREAISAVMDGLTNFRAVLRGDPNGMVSKKVRPLVDMAERLRAQGDLQVGGTALCSAVRGYGVYEPLKGDLVAGRENRALLYCEVNGFASRPGEGGMWETKLSQEVVLYRGETEVWKKGKADDIVDRCRNKRRDFYTMNLIALPAALPAGQYKLKVTVIDQVAGRVAEGVLPVTIAGAGIAAGQ